MKIIETFLTELAGLRRMDQARLRSSLNLPFEFSLPPELSIAADHRWIVSPVLTQSIYTPREVYIGIPANDRIQLEYWAAHLPECDWVLLTGRDSEVLALEIDTRQDTGTLRNLCCDDWSWQDTLQFHIGDRCVALFRCIETSISGLGEGLSGLKLHYGDPILIPSSRVDSEGALSYLDTCAPLKDAPDWLLSRPEYESRQDLTHCVNRFVVPILTRLTNQGT